MRGCGNSTSASNTSYYTTDAAAARTAAALTHLVWHGPACRPNTPTVVGLLPDPVHASHRAQQEG